MVRYVDSLCAAVRYGGRQQLDLYSHLRGEHQVTGRTCAHAQHVGPVMFGRWCGWRNRRVVTARDV